MNILVWHGKHGDAFYDASTPERKEASAMELLRNWAGYWIVEPEDPMKHIQYSGIDLEQAALTDEQIDALPTEKLREEASKHKKNLARLHANYRQELAEWDELQRVLAGEEFYEPQTYYRANSSDGSHKKGDPAPLRRVTAWRVLQTYADGEYMGVSEESVWTPKEES